MHASCRENQYSTSSIPPLASRILKHTPFEGAQEEGGQDAHHGQQQQVEPELRVGPVDANEHEVELRCVLDGERAPGQQVDEPNACAHRPRSMACSLAPCLCACIGTGCDGRACAPPAALGGVWRTWGGGAWLVPTVG